MYTKSNAEILVIHPLNYVNYIVFYSPYFYKAVEHFLLLRNFIHVPY